MQARRLEAAEGVRRIPKAEARLEHELADCLWSLLVIAGLYGVDIEQAFLLNMDQLEAQLKSQTG
jgi:NTP pyrophosphatase (non-canonical NTP hydrolase)